MSYELLGVFIDILYALLEIVRHIFLTYSDEN